MPNSAIGYAGGIPGQMQLAINSVGISEWLSMLIDKNTGNIKILTLEQAAEQGSDADGLGLNRLTTNIYYAFNEEPGGTIAVDYRGVFPGTYSGTVTTQSYGPSDGAAVFASGSYMTSGTPSDGTALNLLTSLVSINVPAADVMFWFKVDEYPSVESLIWGFVENESVWRTCVTLDNLGTLRLRISSDTTAYQQFTNFKVDEWNYISFTFNPVGVINFQLNVGNVDSNVVYSTGGAGFPTPFTFTNANNLYFCGGPNSPFPGCPGTFDEFLLIEGTVIEM